jgi:hypothetical protein
MTPNIRKLQPIRPFLMGNKKQLPADTAVYLVVQAHDPAQGTTIVAEGVTKEKVSAPTGLN